MKPTDYHFLRERLTFALAELAKLSYDFALYLPLDSVFIQEGNDSSFWWQIEVQYLDRFEEEGAQIILFAVDIRDGKIALGATLYYSSKSHAQYRIDDDFRSTSGKPIKN